MTHHCQYHPGIPFYFRARILCQPHCWDSMGKGVVNRETLGTRENLQDSTALGTARELESVDRKTVAAGSRGDWTGHKTDIAKHLRLTSGPKALQRSVRAEIIQEMKFWQAKNNLRWIMLKYWKQIRK